MRMSEWIDPDLHRTFIAQQTDALRLCTAPDGWVERFGVDVLISHKTVGALEWVKNEVCPWALNVGFSFRRVFARFLPKQNADREAPTLILGDPDTNVQSTALERSLCYAIDFSAGYSVGLFIDQRENRRFVRDLAPATLLNCFAYTCSFSVAAATVGATTVSVDLSKKSLARGRENFGLNSVSTTDHQFIADDVMAVLPRLTGGGEKFDVIILDPPGAVRNSSDQLMILYFHDQLKLNLAEKPAAVLWTVNLMPLVAVLGSFSAGVVSDKFFKGHRSPVAMTLYFIECGVILTAAIVIAAGIVGPTPIGIFIGCLFLVLVALTANSTHAIVGTAAPMDIGGRKMAGFASGVVDSFQYYGTAIALPMTGWLIDHFGWSTWYPTMASFGAIGGCSMLLVMRKQRLMLRAGDLRAQSR